MRVSKLQMTAAAMAAMLLVGGCGDAPYALTDQEERIIVDYSAHILSKYNKFQREGLAYVSLESPETDMPEETVPDVTEPEVSEDLPEETGQTEPEEAADVPTVQTASLQEIFGTDSISVTYAGARLAESYVQDEYYALNADAGKSYLIVGIDVANNGTTDLEFNQLTAAPKFEAVVNGDVTCSSELTFLLEDFSSYEDTVSAGATVETVLLFQVPDTVTDVASLQLNVAINGNNYQIIL